MPFLNPLNKILDCVFLQVQKLTNKVFSFVNYKNKKIKYEKRYKRVCLFTSPKLKKGSVTVEAAISMMLFILIILFMGSFAIMFNTELAVQIGINNIAREVAKERFYAEAFSGMADNSESLAEIKEKIGELIQNDEAEDAGGLEDILKNEFNAGYIAIKLAAYENSDSAGSYQFSTLKNFNIAESMISEETVDVVVRYNMKIPLLNRYMAVSQRARVKDWTGKDLTAESEKVYITENGTVYHRSKQCSHLNISVSRSTFGQISSLRNKNGKKYSKCSYCVEGSLSGDSTVYVTEEGTKYHTSLQCGGLTRKIIEIDIDQVGDKSPCSECGQGE